MSEDTQLVRRSDAALTVMPVMNIAQALERYETFKEFHQKVMEKDQDYGTIPGTNKPTLYKPGAEKLNMFFGLSPVMRLIESIEDWTGVDHGGEPLFYYRYACDLMRGDSLAGTSEASCNSREVKYRWRKGERTCPECGSATVFVSKNKAEGFYCWRKKNGCGATFGPNDERITGQNIDRVANPDIGDLVNTIQKMAQKRAFVGTTLLAVNASAYFTQDLEDMPQANHAPQRNDDNEPAPASKGTSERDVLAAEIKTIWAEQGNPPAMLAKKVFELFKKQPTQLSIVQLKELKHSLIEQNVPEDEQMDPSIVEGEIAEEGTGDFNDDGTEPATESQIAALRAWGKKHKTNVEQACEARMQVDFTELTTGQAADFLSMLQEG